MRIDAELMKVGRLPDLVTNAGNQQPKPVQLPTLPNIEWVIRAMGLRLRFDMMVGGYIICGAGVGLDLKAQARVLYEVRDQLMRMRIKLGIGDLADVLNMLSFGDCFHSMQDWIEAVEWDGVDRFDELCNSVSTSTELWPVYLRKWMIQTIEGVCGWDGEPRSLPHVLCFVGGQGVGKGRWVRSLVPAGFVLADAELHLNAVASKDQQINVLARPVVELSEIDASFRKSDVSSLKSFLGRVEDNIRAPYAKTALPRARVTCFFASVNNAEFLNDPTGTRRFWPVALSDVVWDHEVDMQQMWAQAQAWWLEGEDWNLGDVDDGLRVADAVQFTAQAAAADLVEGHREKYREDYKRYALLNKTEIARVCGAGTHPFGLSAVTEWLLKNLGDARKLGGKQRCWAFPIGDVNGFNTDIKCIDENQAKKYVLAQNAKT